ncbi:hypothetical protein HELRODRAFT_173973 [Helobdella robusta]|uniref:Uncharacterized protein n=1 Tax=Helobdella robusta TaxID=6412 RepID=T1F7F5_HELRO|nr:hypothetical protein HELRODRAFT_173973 [Helobdella robusta]ESO03091.1 hypothetical protein HELRODRAFT_173973 [Helobdella robusta]
MADQSGKLHRFPYHRQSQCYQAGVIIDGFHDNNNNNKNNNNNINNMKHNISICTDQERLTPITETTRHQAVVQLGTKSTTQPDVSHFLVHFQATTTSKTVQCNI